MEQSLFSHVCYRDSTRGQKPEKCDGPDVRSGILSVELFRGAALASIQGTQAEVYEVVAQLYGRYASPDSPGVRDQANVILDAARYEKEVEVKWLDLFLYDEV